MPGKMKSTTGRPILGSTTASRDRIITFALVFRRWATAREGRDVDIPPCFLEELRHHVLDPEIHLDFDEGFHLRLPRAIDTDSSQAKLIFDFSTGPRVRFDDDNDEEERSLILVRYVRKSDNDRHLLDVRTGEVKSISGHWMSGDRETRSSLPAILPSPLPRDASELLCNHWIAPARWLSEGRAVVVRPQDATTASVTLCGTARQALSDGFTLLLVVGDLISVRLPGEGDGLNVLFAGMMWRNFLPQSERKSADDGIDSLLGVRPDGSTLAFLVAEYEQRKGFSGQNDDEERLRRNAPPRFEDGMYIWQRRDIYEYYPFPWN